MFCKLPANQKARHSAFRFAIDNIFSDILIGQHSIETVPFLSQKVAKGKEFTNYIFKIFLR
eukprot:UN09982